MVHHLAYQKVPQVRHNETLYLLLDQVLKWYIVCTNWSDTFEDINKKCDLLYILSFYILSHYFAYISIRYIADPKNAAL